MAALTLTFAAVAAAPLPAATLDRSMTQPQGKGAVSKEDARRAITIFRRDPLGSQGEMTRPIILKFAEDSPDVEISLSDKRLAWVGNKSVPEETTRILIVAYVAGDVQSQLDSGKTKDDPVAATEQVIATYAQLKRANPELHVREVEELIRLQKQGKLAEHFKDEEPAEPRRRGE